MVTLSRSLTFILAVAIVAVFAEGPDVSFSGFLDADIVADFEGGYTNSQELDLGMSVQLSEKVAANVYATVRTGRVPAMGENTDMRWPALAFDGYDISYESSVGTFSIGDLVYQYGKFNYYFYKRLSMITNESFTRGLKYSFSSDMITQEVLVGIADNSSGSTSDIQGATSIKIDDANGVGVYYGIQNNAMLSFEDGSNIYAGAEYNGSFGDMLALKADVGYMGLAEKNSEGDRSNLISVLVEPTLTMGKFSAAFTGYYMYDGDTLTNSSTYFGLGDEMFFYLEPGYSFTDIFAAGLPLEYHAGALDDASDNSIWIVPTLYFTFAENVQWWLWGQVVLDASDADEKADPDFYAGSEIIVTF